MSNNKARQAVPAVTVIQVGDRVDRRSEWVEGLTATEGRNRHVTSLSCTP